MHPWWRGRYQSCNQVPATHVARVWQDWHLPSTCKVGQKLGVSLPVFTCSPSAWPTHLLYRRGRKSRRDFWIILYFPLLRCLYHDFIITSYHPLSAFQVDIFKEFYSLQFCTHSLYITQRAELVQHPNFLTVNTVCTYTCINKEVAPYRKLHYTIANCVAFGTRVCLSVSGIVIFITPMTVCGKVDTVFRPKQKRSVCHSCFHFTLILSFREYHSSLWEACNVSINY